MNENGRPSTEQERQRIERWVAEHARAVRGYLRGLIQENWVIDDLVQEVFCRAWLARERYVESGKERAYLLRIADRLARDVYRRPKRERFADRELLDLYSGPDDRDPSHSLQRGELKSQLDQAMQSLTENQRRTLLLRYYGELSFAEIAETMQCSINTVLSHCHRGLQTLRKNLAQANE